MCRAPVDVLRAPYVAHRAGHFAYYCSFACFEQRADVEGSLRGSTATSDPLARPQREPEDLVEEPLVPDDLQLEAPSPVVEDSAPLLSQPLPVLVSFVGEPTLDELRIMLGIRSVVESQSEGPAQIPDLVERRAEPLILAPITWVPLGAAALCTAITLIAMLSSSGISLAFSSIAALGALTIAGRTLWSLRVLAHPLWWSTPFAASLLMIARASSVHSAGTSLALAALCASVLPLRAWFVHRTMHSALGALDAQQRWLPLTARVIRGAASEPTILESKQVRAGEEVLVDAGERVPTDGVVREGEATLETGSHARTVSVGHSVLAGAYVRTGSLQLLATRAGEDAAIMRARAIFDGREERGALPATARSLPTLAVITVAMATAIALFVAPQDPLATLALTLVALPLGPLRVLSRAPWMHAAAQSLSRGTVFRDLPALTLASRVGMLVLSVRATLTRGVFELCEIVSMGHWTEKELLALAAGAEQQAPEHPIATAILDAARARQLRPDPVRRPIPMPGKGIVAATSLGAPLVVGSRALLIAEGIAVAPGEELARAIEAHGRHAVFIAVSGRLEGILGLEDRPREDARNTVQTLIDAGLAVALVGGESANTLDALALSLDVAQVRAEVSPEDRPAQIRALGELSGYVAVAGHPALDDLALGAADVSIGLASAGGTGAECTIALSGDALRDASDALLLARRARKASQSMLWTLMISGVFGALGRTLGFSLAIATLLALVVPTVGLWLAGRYTLQDQPSEGT